MPKCKSSLPSVRRQARKTVCEFQTEAEHKVVRWSGVRSPLKDAGHQTPPGPCEILAIFGVLYEMLFLQRHAPYEEGQGQYEHREIAQVRIRHQVADRQYHPPGIDRMAHPSKWSGRDDTAISRQQSEATAEVEARDLRV